MSEPALSIRIADIFYDVCNDAYICWKIHRILFDDNHDKNKFKRGGAFSCVRWISIYIQGTALSKIAKLHDPCIQNCNINVTAEYIIEYGGWTNAVRKRLSKLNNEMSGLAKRIKPARDKVLSHNDLKTRLNKDTVGGFEEDADVKYFKDLQEFVDIIFTELEGKGRPFNTHIATQAEAFRQVLLIGMPKNEKDQKA